MKVKVIKAFLDSTMGHLRAVGNEYDTTQQRFNEINGHSAGPFLEEVVEEKAEKPAPKKGK